MSLDADTLFALLPAVYRTRDAANGGPLQALFAVLATQAGIVEDNIRQLYNDQFIETCQNWAIPYIGDLIGYNSIYQSTAGIDSRPEVANTIGYRRRKGTLIALEQVAIDVSGRVAVVVEEFKRLIVNESLRHVRVHHAATLNLRRGGMLDQLNSAFDRSSRTIDVRRIAPRIRRVSDPDAAPLEIALHGPGGFNIPDIAIYLWRWRPWMMARAPASPIDARRYRFNPLGLDIPLFSQPPPESAPFSRVNSRMDVPQAIGREEFARHIADFYGPSIVLWVDDVAADVSRICCANLAERPDGSWCTVAPGKIAIDPELGRIQFASDLPAPKTLRVSYSYGFPAAIGGGRYDRAAYLTHVSASAASFTAVVGSAGYPTLESAVAAWNLQPADAIGLIVLQSYERYAIDLTGAQALQLPAGSRLTLGAARVVISPGVFELIWNETCVSLQGNIDVISGPGAVPGQLTINGLWIAGELRIVGSPANVNISDTTLLPGLGAASPGLSAGDPSISMIAIETTLTMQRCISGPIYADATGSVRIEGSIVDATSPCCVAFAGPDEFSAGADLCIEDSTIIGKVRTRTMRLASNTIFVARRARHDPWPAAIWCSRRQVGCVRFSYLPFDSITPRRYECMPPAAQTQASYEPTFITLRYGQPSYALLSGDVPMAIWQGADNGSQMGVYYQIQETEAVSNVQIRSGEYLPVALQSGVFLNPSRPLSRPRPARPAYGLEVRACCDDGDDEPMFYGVGNDLL